MLASPCGDTGSDVPWQIPCSSGRDVPSSLRSRRLGDATVTRPCRPWRSIDDEAALGDGGSYCPHLPSEICRGARTGRATFCAGALSVAHTTSISSSCAQSRILSRASVCRRATHRRGRVVVCGLNARSVRYDEVGCRTCSRVHDRGCVPRGDYFDEPTSRTRGRRESREFGVGRSREPDWFDVVMVRVTGAC